MTSILFHRNVYIIDGVTLSPVQIKQFWAMVKRSSLEGDCWVWQDARSKSGHGIFVPEYQDSDGRPLWAHRVAFSLSSLIQVPEGLCVRHTCGLAHCCNPAHLILGTQAENWQDTLDHKAMEAALTDEDRTVIATSKARIVHLARRFNVTNGIVWTIKFGKPGIRRTSTARIAA